MTAQVLEAVPNFSEGRDLGVVRAIVDAIGHAGATVLDWSADPDHHRSVITIVGRPEIVEHAVVAGAHVAFEHIDLQHHDGVHPRVGALDVLPFVPLAGLTLEQAREVAQRVGRRIAVEFGVPVYFYGQASDPPGRSLAELRRGGFEELLGGWPAGRTPDVLPDAWVHPGAHPKLGVICVGARTVLLAWNVFLTGLGIAQAKDVARELRERKSGLAGVRALALELPRRRAIQISMNLEDPGVTSPALVFDRLEALVAARGGRIVETEIIGLMPDELVVSIAEERLRLIPGTSSRLLSRQLARYLADVMNHADERSE
jgi:glutamate formiminotransferase / 5-formyltetrahydrofolate cyclo-ligase